MSDPTDPLAQPCPRCGQPIGEHRLRDWLTHTNVGHHEIPFVGIEVEPGTSDGQFCGRTTMFYAELDTDPTPLDALFCAYEWDPELATFRRSCEGDTGTQPEAAS